MTWDLKPHSPGKKILKIHLIVVKIKHYLSVNKPFCLKNYSTKYFKLVPYFWTIKIYSSHRGIRTHNLVICIRAPNPLSHTGVVICWYHFVTINNKFLFRNFRKLDRTLTKNMSFWLQWNIQWIKSGVVSNKCRLGLFAYPH